MKFLTSVFIASIFAFSCTAKKDICDEDTFQRLHIWAANTDLKLPPYTIDDTIKYDKETILDYNIKSLDSSIRLNAFVYKSDSSKISDLDHLMVVQKKEVESGQNSKELLRETFKIIDNNKIGYILYLIKQANEEFFAGRVFFYHNKKLVVLWLFEKYHKNSDKEHLIMDCILNSIEFN